MRTVASAKGIASSSPFLTSLQQESVRTANEVDGLHSSTTVDVRSGGKAKKDSEKLGRGLATVNPPGTTTMTITESPTSAPSARWQGIEVHDGQSGPVTARSCDIASCADDPFGAIESPRANSTDTSEENPIDSGVQNTSENAASVSLPAAQESGVEQSGAAVGTCLSPVLSALRVAMQSALGSAALSPPAHSPIKNRPSEAPIGVLPTGADVRSDPTSNEWVGPVHQPVRYGFVYQQYALPVAVSTVHGGMISSAAVGTTKRMLASAKSATVNASGELSRPASESKDQAVNSDANDQGQGRQSISDASAEIDASPAGRVVASTNSAQADGPIASAMPDTQSTAPRPTAPVGQEKGLTKTPNDPQTTAGSTPLAADGSLSLGNVRLTQRVGQAEMTIGLHSAEFGAISIRTSNVKDQIAAEVWVDHAELSKALLEHLPAMQSGANGTQPIEVRITGHTPSAEGLEQRSSGSTADGLGSEDRQHSSRGAVTQTVGTVQSPRPVSFIAAGAATQQIPNSSARLDVQA